MTKPKEPTPQLPQSFGRLNSPVWLQAVDVWNACHVLECACDAWLAWFRELRDTGDADPSVAMRQSETVQRCVDVVCDNVRPRFASGIRETVMHLPMLPTSLHAETRNDTHGETGEFVEAEFPGWQKDPDLWASYYGTPKSGCHALNRLVGLAQTVQRSLAEYPATTLKFNISAARRAAEQDPETGGDGGGQHKLCVGEATEDEEEPSAAHNDEEPTTENSLRRVSLGWRIVAFGEQNDFSDMLGFSMIAQLLAACGDWIPSARLSGVESDPVYKANKSGEHKRWDDRTRRDVNNRIAELVEKIDRLKQECAEAKADNDEPAINDSASELQTAETQLTDLKKHRSEALHSSGEARELNPPDRKLHDNVRNCINRALASLKKKSLSKTYGHLESSIRPNGKGFAYAYRPEAATNWTVVIETE